MNKCTIAILIVNSIFCAIGILLILISCIQYSTWWPIMTITVHALAVVIPLVFANNNNEFSMDDQVSVNCSMVAWLFVGIFVITGYAIPSILRRADVIPEVGLILTFVGGTVILMSILIFVRAVYFAKEINHAYMF